MTPEDRHSGRDVEILANRHRVYQRARRRNPGRWSRHTRNWNRIEVVYLNLERAAEDPVLAIDLRRIVAALSPGAAGYLQLLFDAGAVSFAQASKQLGVTADAVEAAATELAHALAGLADS